VITKHFIVSLVLRDAQPPQHAEDISAAVRLGLYFFPDEPVFVTELSPDEVALLDGRIKI
jgi:hypothetical protein